MGDLVFEVRNGFESAPPIFRRVIVEESLRQRLVERLPSDGRSNSVIVDTESHQRENRAGLWRRPFAHRAGR